MSAVDADTIPRVLDPGVLEALGEQVVSAASTLESAMVTVHGRWGGLREVFVATGTEGAYAMLDPAVGASHEYVTAMIQARVVLDNAATGVLPALQKRRDELLARVGEVNQQHSEASEMLPETESAYWRSFDRDPDSDATATARSERADALHAMDNANQAVSTLRNDIEKLRQDIDRDEEFIARQLGWITGGETVYGAWGEKINVSQTYWGTSVPTYPGGPTASFGLADYLANHLATQLRAYGKKQTADTDEPVELLDDAARFSYDKLVEWTSSDDYQTIYQVARDNPARLRDLLNNVIDLRAGNWISLPAFLFNVTGYDGAQVVASAYLIHDQFQTGSTWDLKIYLAEEYDRPLEDGAFTLTNADGESVRSDVFGNVNYGAMLANAGVPLDLALRAANSGAETGLGDDSLDDAAVVLGYEMVAEYPDGMSVDEYVDFILASNVEGRSD